MKYSTFKNKLLSNPEFLAEVNKDDLVRDISRMIIEARIIRGISQAELARLIGTKQPSIARIEKGKSLPRLGFIQKIALALKTKLTVRFDLLENNNKTYTSTWIAEPHNYLESIRPNSIFYGTPQLSTLNRDFIN